MPLREKDRNRARRQRRKKKLAKYKAMYAEAKTLKEKQEIEAKIHKHQPGWEPDES
jgi:dynactin complex subunit